MGWLGGKQHMYTSSFMRSSFHGHAMILFSYKDYHDYIFPWLSYKLPPYCFPSFQLFFGFFFFRKFDIISVIGHLKIKLCVCYN